MAKGPHKRLAILESPIFWAASKIKDRRMNAVDGLFRNLRAQKRKAFIPFLTAGDPDLETTASLAHEVARRGASLIEIGFPYSDPIADGAVVQASYTRALAKGLKIDQIFGLIRRLR